MRWRWCCWPASRCSAESWRSWSASSWSAYPPGRPGGPQHRFHPQVADRGAGAPQPEQIDNAGNAAIQALREQSRQADQRRAVDRGHDHRNRHRRAAGAVHADFLAHGGRNILAFVTKIVPVSVRERVRDCRRRRIRVADRLCARDLPGRVGRRDRHRHRPGDHGYPVGAAAGVAGVPRRVHPAGRCGDRGFLAVVVALLAKGWVYALITLGLIIAVNSSRRTSCSRW